MTGTTRTKGYTQSPHTSLSGLGFSNWVTSELKSACLLSAVKSSLQIASTWLKLSFKLQVSGANNFPKPAEIPRSSSAETYFKLPITEAEPRQPFTAIILLDPWQSGLSMALRTTPADNSNTSCWATAIQERASESLTSTDVSIIHCGYRAAVGKICF